LINSKLFSLWRKEWKKHLLCQTSTSFCTTLDADYIASDDEVRNSISQFITFLLKQKLIGFLQGVDEEPPTISNHNQPIQYRPPSAFPHIGVDAPMVADLMKGQGTKKRKVSSKTISSKKCMLGSSSSAAPRTPSHIEIPQVIDFFL